MKAALWYEKKDVRVEEVPDSPPGDGWVRAKVYWCGICGTDVHEYEAGPIMIRMTPHPLSGLRPPIILGHEFSAEVVECGKGVKSLKPGDRIVTHPLYTCGICFWCKRGLYHLCEKLGAIGLSWHGAFAEYINVKAEHCYHIPPRVDNDVAALVEPMAAAIHAVRKSRILGGEDVAVIGAGPIGLMVLQAAKAAGARRLFSVEISKTRGKKAEAYGAIHLNPSDKEYRTKLLDYSDGIGPDVVIECVGIPATGPMAIDLARTGGRAVIMGVFTGISRLNFNELVFAEKEVIGSIECCVEEFETVLHFLADGRLSGKELITGRIVLDDLIEKGFNELVRNKENHCKILVRPN